MVAFLRGRIPRCRHRGGAFGNRVNGTKDYHHGGIVNAVLNARIHPRHLGGVIGEGPVQCLDDGYRVMGEQPIPAS